MPARKTIRRKAKRSKSLKARRNNRISVISDILSSQYGVKSKTKSKSSKKSVKRKRTPQKKKSTPKKGMKYKDFVKKEFPKVKKEMPDAPFGDITKEVARRWKAKSNQ